MSQELAQYYVQIVPSANGMGGKIVDELDGEEAGKQTGNNIVKSLLKVFAVAKIGEGLKRALDIGGALEQSIGGVKAILGDDAFADVYKMAQESATTLQISANAYMEQVTSFSAKLMQDLGGDTQRVVDVSNIAITSMSDNANKMGTSIESIQNAYQGFAKQNFTMLDNLKLGYGGTKTEMERLLADAEQIKLANGEMVSYSIDSFADMVEAIQVVQENMGVAGTSAQEAETTITGSIGSLKASWENFVANMTLGEDVQPSLDALVKTVTAVINNLIPKVVNIMATLPQSFLSTVITLAPTLIEAGVTMITTIITGLADAMPDLIPQIVTMVTLIATTLLDNAPQLLMAGVKLVFALATGLIQAIPQILSSVGQIIKKGLEAVGNFLIDWSNMGRDLIMGLANGIANSVTAVIKKVKEVATTILSKVKGFFGIHSPSKEFAEIGKMNMLGLAEGFEDNMKPVQNAINDIGTATMQDFESDVRLSTSYASGTSASDFVGEGGVDYGGVTINVYGEDKSVTEIASEVTEILQNQITMQRRVFQ